MLLYEVEVKARARDQEREQEEFSQYLAWVESKFVSLFTHHTLQPSTVGISLASGSSSCSKLVQHVVMGSAGLQELLSMTPYSLLPVQTSRRGQLSAICQT